jgi:hypothetical protein
MSSNAKAQRCEAKDYLDALFPKKEAIKDNRAV